MMTISHVDFSVYNDSHLPIIPTHLLISTTQVKLQLMSFFQVFGHKPKYWTNKDFDPNAALDHKCQPLGGPRGRVRGNQSH